MQSTMPRNKANKQKILLAAIDLFSQKGYAGVSLREIAAAVGIRASSIYNHYTGKEAILEAVTAYFCEGLHAQVYPAYEQAEYPDIEAFINCTTEANDRFFADPVFAGIGIIILRDQFQNASIRGMLLRELLEEPRRLIARHFESLMLAGKMRGADATVAAKEYHAFYIYGFYETALAQHETLPPERLLFERAEHVRLFLKNWALDTPSA